MPECKAPGNSNFKYAPKDVRMNLVQQFQVDEEVSSHHDDPLNNSLNY
jgi:hypothetical protein